MIAARLGSAPSTISRELRRNVRPHGRGIYDRDLAHARARERPRRRGRGRLIDDPQLRAVVQAKLELEWSPEQIAAHLRAAYPGSPRWHVCHETIYQALDHGGKGGRSRQLATRLRLGGRCANAAGSLANGGSGSSPPPCSSSTGPSRWTAAADRRLGRRPHHRVDEPVRDRHPRGPLQPLRAPRKSE